MRLEKKIVLLSVLFATLNLPLIAHANLITNNYTNEPSTVRVTTGSLKPCSAIDPAYGITQPQEKNHVVPSETVKLLCKTGPADRCEADLFMTNHCGSASEAVAHAILNLKDGTVTVTNYPGKAYLVDASSSTVNIRYR